MRRSVSEKSDSGDSESLVDSGSDLLGRKPKVLGAESHVVAHRWAEELIVRILEDHAYLLPKPAMQHSLAEERYLTRAGLEHSAGEQEERRLPGAVGSDETQFLPARNLQVHLSQYIGSVRIGER